MGGRKRIRYRNPPLVWVGRRPFSDEPRCGGTPKIDHEYTNQLRDWWGLRLTPCSVVPILRSKSRFLDGVEEQPLHLRSCDIQAVRRVQRRESAESRITFYGQITSAERRCGGTRPMKPESKIRRYSRCLARLVLCLPKYQTTMKSEYKFRKFTDGWWSIIYYLSLENWGKWRGPFDTKADAEIDCAQASQGKYSL